MSGSPLDALGSAKADKSFAYTADLLAAIFTWGGIGFLIDRLVGTEPVFMVVGFVIGNIAGIYLLYIRAKQADAADAAMAARSEEGTTPRSR